MFIRKKMAPRARPTHAFFLPTPPVRLAFTIPTMLRTMAASGIAPIGQRKTARKARSRPAIAEKFLEGVSALAMFTAP
jgi:hypothetical protein